nr:hypothetical protein [Tanacetum cinerariifolium]
MKKAFQDMLHDLGEVNPTHAYCNGSRTSKDNEDPSWNTSFKNKRTLKTTSALEALWKTLFNSGSNLNNEENDFMLDTSYGNETIEELTVAVMLMARIQPANGNAKTVPSYDEKVVSEVYFTCDHNNSRQNTSLRSFRQELLEYMGVHDNDASESSQPSWGKMCTYGT